MRPRRFHERKLRGEGRGHIHPGKRNQVWIYRVGAQDEDFLDFLARFDKEREQLVRLSYPQLAIPGLWFEALAGNKIPSARKR